MKATFTNNQQNLPLRDELIIDNFAGGGGASTGIEAAFGRPVDIAINHDREAIAMHQVNHPNTKHYCEDVFDIDPIKVTKGQPVGLAWFSPDCKHFSKAKGSKPVEKKIRGLAWVVIKWAVKTKPRVIMLENVEEFQTWGPLLENNKPCPIRKGLTFRRWVNQLKELGYQVEHKELRACDYGAPTIRKRLFVIARCDGYPIVWPQPTHGNPKSKEVKSGKLKPWLTAAQCIDWNIPAPSIFERKRALVENTMRRIAKGIMRYVINSPNPYIVNFHGITIPHIQRQFKNSVGHGIDHPSGTLMANGSGKSALVTAFLTEHANASNQRNFNIKEPLRTQCAQVKGGHFAVVVPFLAKHYGGNYTGPGIGMQEPTGTVTTVDHHALVAALMAPYYGSGSGETGIDISKPSPTVTSKDRLQLITVNIDGKSYILTDIGMRMLQPRELYRAQGFHDDYIIDIEIDNKKLSKAAQVRMCGNSVCPPVATALVKANFAHEQKYKQVI